MVVRAALPLSVACALAVCACTQNGSEDAGTDIDLGSGSIGLLSVERFVDTESLPRLVAGAKIARYHGIQGETLLGLLGAQPRELESCRVEGGLDQFALSADAHLELLSVGDITVRLGETVTTLSPKLFPALASTASGSFYAGDADIVAPRAELDEYLLSAHGEDGVGAFELSAAAPGELAGLAADGVKFEVSASPTARMAIARQHSLTLTWEPEDPRDRIEVELYAGGSVLSCACRDDGHFALSAEQLASIDADDNASMVVRRVRIVPVEVQGIDTAYARIATTSTLEAAVK
jgi:hypothetical protein